ncbi:MAG: hypothetical protein K2J76_03270, partial [Oscillospiraceae bacterium]|nr:hypothetical protein [Oscillospiraceae bacterium]
PLGAVFYLKTIVFYDHGYSWASMKMESKLRKIGRLFKKGEYRKALDCFEPYYKDDYTDEELNAFKDKYAEILEDYFLNFEIQAILYEPDEGDTERGGIAIWDGDGYTLSMWFENLPDGKLRYDGFYSSYQDVSGNFLPYMYIPERAQIERDFDTITDTENHYVPLAFDILTDNYIYSEDRDSFALAEEVSRKMRELVKKYGYVGCEGGEVTFYYDNLYEDYKLMAEGYSHISHRTNNYYLQKVKLTMDNNGDNFTVEFDMPIRTEYMYSLYSSARNIVYSNNTPEDFKTMFEDIFVGFEEPKPTVNDGKFYLNGNNESCYFTVSEGYLRLIADSEEQKRELYNEQCEDDPTFADKNSFDKWCEELEEDWRYQKSYIVHRDLFGSYKIAWHLVYGSDHFLIGYLSARYIDEDNFEYNGCRFTRTEE